MDCARALGAMAAMKAPCILAIALAATLAATANAGQSEHTITVTFNYDFTHQPPCSAQIPQKTEHKRRKGEEEQEEECIQQFVVYDISAGLAKRTKLMFIPAPPGAHGMVKGISGTTPRLLFESGRHLIAVVAQTAKGSESDPEQATVWVKIPDS
jgi:hypothetical protein